MGRGVGGGVVDGREGRRGLQSPIKWYSEKKDGFTSTETVGLLGTGAQDVHLDFHTAPELSLTMVG